MHIAWFHIHARGARMYVCVCGDHIYEFEYLCVPILSHSILCIPLRGMDPSHIPISSEAKESLQKHHKKMRIKGSIFCNSADIRWCQRCGFVPSKLSTLKPLKVQGLTVWFKMSWYAHFIFLLLCCCTILIFVSGHLGIWIFWMYVLQIWCMRSCFPRGAAAGSGLAPFNLWLSASCVSQGRNTWHRHQT